MPSTTNSASLNITTLFSGIVNVASCANVYDTPLATITEYSALFNA